MKKKEKSAKEFNAEQQNNKEVKTDSEAAKKEKKNASKNEEKAQEEQKSSNNEEQEEDKEQNSKKDQEAESAEEKFHKLNEKYLRLAAEYDNYRKRTLKEKMDLVKNAGEDILSNFLPIIDNIDRAKKSVDETEDIESVKEGIDLIHKNLKDFIASRGVKEIDAIGKEFDTDLHEAVTKIPAPEEDLKGKVIDVIEKGYKLNDKVIRYAKVVVGE